MINQKTGERSFEVNSELTLSELFDLIVRNKLTVLISVSFFSIASLVYAFSLEDVYKSEAILASVPEDRSSNSQLYDLSEFAGFNLGSSKLNKSDQALEILKSLDFFEAFATKYDVLVPLMAATGWNKEKNELVFTKNFEKKIYSTQEAHKVFLNKLNISPDSKGIIKISLEHFSPFVAQNWLERLIFEINSTIKEEDKYKAEQSISFLKEEISKTDFIGIKSSLNNLIEKQIETVMLANTTPDYVFTTLSKPFSPEKKYLPNRLLILSMGFIFGFSISFLYIFLRFHLVKFK